MKMVLFLMIVLPSLTLISCFAKVTEAFFLVHQNSEKRQEQRKKTSHLPQGIPTRNYVHLLNVNT